MHVDPASVLPVIGTKEFIAWLPVMLGLGPADTVIYPSLAYPTYDIGARLAGAASMAADVLDEAPSSTRLLWVNSPSNPTGRVLPAAALQGAVAWAREHGCVLASDECYIELGWTATPVSAPHSCVRGVSLDGVLAVFSLSKRSTSPGTGPGSFAEDEHPVSQRQCLIDVVGDEQHGGLVPGPQRQDQPVHRHPGQRVQRAERFVKQQQRRLAHQGPGQRCPLRLTTGQRQRPCRRALGKADLGEGTPRR